MDHSLLAALLTAVLSGLGGLLVPRLIAATPEPPPREADGDVDEDPDPEPPKILYADLAARPGLAVRSAAVSAVAGGLVGWATGLDWPLLWLVWLVPVGVALSVIDWHTRLLPRIIVIPATAAALVLVVAVGLATGQRPALVSALVVMVVARSFFWVLWSVLGGAGMGFGDVRLSALVGLVLGWLGAGAALWGFWIGMVVFGVPGLVLAIARRDRSVMKQAFPFGPFMIVGALLGLVWGTAVAGRMWG